MLPLIASPPSAQIITYLHPSNTRSFPKVVMFALDCYRQQNRHFHNFILRLDSFPELQNSGKSICSFIIDGHTGEVRQKRHQGQGIGKGSEIPGPSNYAISHAPLYLTDPKALRSLGFFGCLLITQP